MSAPTWSVMPDDLLDAPLTISLSMDGGDGHAMGLRLADVDGEVSTAVARRLAAVLLSAADYADSCVLVPVVQGGAS